MTSNTVSDTPDTQIPINVKKLESTFFHDGLFLKEVLQGYRSTHASCIQQMRDGLSTRNEAALSNASHKLKGSTLNFIQGDVTNSLEEIERESRKQNLSKITSSDIDKIDVQLKHLIEQLTVLAEEWISKAH